MHSDGSSRFPDIADAREELQVAGYPEGGPLFRLLDQLEAERGKGEVDRLVAEEREALEADQAFTYVSASRACAWHLTSRGDYPQEDGDYLVVFEDGDEEVMRVFFWSHDRATEDGFHPQAGWTTDESWSWHETPVTAWRRLPAGPGDCA